MVEEGEAEYLAGARQVRAQQVEARGHFIRAGFARQETNEGIAHDDRVI